VTIRFSCPKCSKSLTVTDDKAGVKAACPGCRSPFRVPASGRACSGGGQVAKSASAAAMDAATGHQPKTNHGGGTAPSLSEWGQVDAGLDRGVGVLDRDLFKQEEAQIRANLTAYVESVPHHNFQELGKKVTITRVREFRTYRVILDSLYERRLVTRKEEPVQGGNIPKATVTEANVRIWSYSYPTSDEFRNSTKENEIEGSKEIRPCRTCGAEKTTVCEGCLGSGAIACPDCRSTGAVSCGRCGGDGFRRVRTGTQQRWVKCGCCGGTGQWYPDSYGPKDHRCPECAGSGRIPKDEEVFQTVPCTCGTGKVQCPTCEGHGKVRCSRCTGSGKTPCTPCKATGQMFSFLAVVQFFEASSQMIPVPCVGFNDQRISEMLVKPDYIPFLTLATTQIPDALHLFRGAEQVRAAITKAFDAARDSISDENRLTRQRLEIDAASVLEVGYQHEGEAYTAWFVGKQLRVHAPVSPITEALQQTAERAVKTWRKGDSKKAALLLCEVADMTKADRYCNAAYDEVRNTIPAGLESKARWVRSQPFIIAGLIAFGVVFLIGIICAVYASQQNFHGRKPKQPAFKDFNQPLDKPLDKHRDLQDAGVAKLLEPARETLRVQDKLSGGVKSKVYHAKMLKGKRYTIDLMSSDFDAYLILESPISKKLAEDDDGGRGVDARIVYLAASTGKYRLLATSLSRNDAGEFMLVVREED
jgi:hypothetical protein